MIVAVLFISFILLIVPLTIFAKPLLGLDMNSNLLLGCLVSLWHHPSLLEVTEVALNWSSVIRVWPRVYHWHLQALDLIHDVLFQVVLRVVHEDEGVFAPKGTLSIEESCELSQEQELHLGICVHLGQGKVGFPFSGNGYYEGDPGIDSTGVYTIDYTPLTPAHAPVVLKVYPSLININDALTL